jgi:hypothetical protein
MSQKTSSDDFWNKIAGWWTSAGPSRRVAAAITGAAVIAFLSALTGVVGLEVTLAAVILFLAGASYPPHSQRTLRHLAGGLCMVLAVVGVGVFLHSVRRASQDADIEARRRESPITVKTESPAEALNVLVAHDGDNRNPCQEIVTSSTEVPSPPIQDAATAADANHLWVQQAGGVYGGESHIKLTIQGTSDEAVVLQGMRVRVVERGKPEGTAVYRLSDGCGGSIPPRSFTVDLDQDQPKAVVQLGAGATGEEVPSVRFPFSVTKSDVEIFFVDARTVECDCQWQLVLDWTQGKRRQTLLIDDNGKPFHTSGLPVGRPKFVANGQNGWLSNGPVRDHRIFVATDGWKGKN